LDQGVSLSRQYFSLDDPKKPITAIQRGDLVRVRLTVVVPAAMHYIVVDDPLPAGFEAVDASILTDTAVPASYTVTDYNERGWGGGILVTSNCAMRRSYSRQITFPLELMFTHT
jgi:uncharacterized protein YfaS (alpha-2-macroglobulin family)